MDHPAKLPSNVWLIGVMLVLLGVCLGVAITRGPITIGRESFDWFVGGPGVLVPPPTPAAPVRPATVPRPPSSIAVHRIPAGESRDEPRFAAIWGDATIDDRTMYDDEAYTGLIVVLEDAATVTAPFGASVFVGFASAAAALTWANAQATSMTCAEARPCASVAIRRWPTDPPQ